MPLILPTLSLLPDFFSKGTVYNITFLRSLDSVQICEQNLINFNYFIQSGSCIDGRMCCIRVALASNPASRKGIFCQSLEDLRLKVGERFKLRRQQLPHLIITTGKTSSLYLSRPLILVEISCANKIRIQDSVLVTYILSKCLSGKSIV